MFKFDHLFHIFIRILQYVWACVNFANVALFNEKFTQLIIYATAGRTSRDKYDVCLIGRIAQNWKKMEKVGAAGMYVIDQKKY